MINQGDGGGRATENVATVRSLFLDLDGAPIQPVLDCGVKPHMIVETSPNRYHAYWFVEDISLSEFKRLQIALAKKFHGDESVSDLPRVARIPGWFNLKREEPFQVRIHSSSDHPRFLKNELVQGLGLELDVPFDAGCTQMVINQGKRNDSLFKRACYLQRRGLSDDEIARKLHLENEELCSPPLFKHEVESIISQALKYKKLSLIHI